MTWQKKLLRILQWPTAAIGGLATAGLVADGAGPKQTTLDATDEPIPDGIILPNTLNANSDDLYAAHGSHRSHSSHASHRSSSGSRRDVPKPIPVPSPRDPPVLETPSEAKPTDQPLPKPTDQDMSAMVVRVQAALMRKGYYNGDIDGLLGKETRAALKEFQKDQKIKETGRMDIDTLTRLGIQLP